MTQKKRFRWLKIVGFIFILLVALLIGLVAWQHKPLPEGESGPQAEALADKILEAVNKSAWDSLAVIQWNFSGRHNLLWDKQRHLAKVEWDTYEAMIDLSTRDGKVWENGERVKENETKLVNTAWALWANDSFWLNPLAKIKDEGTTRKLVTTDEGQEALLVTYNSGGVTPGDSYLWYTDETGLPVAWEMWVSIIPVGGLRFTWENWLTLPGGAKIAQDHNNAVNIKISDIEAANKLGDLFPDKDPFDKLLSK